MEPPEEAALLKSMLTSAEQVLSAAWSGPVRLARDTRGSSLRPGGGVAGHGAELRLDGSARAHSRVMRCSVLASPKPAPATVIVKSFQECAWKDWKGAYDPNDAQQGRTAWRFFNEWAGTQFVERLSGERPLGPRLYGGDRAAGLIVIEDLGEGGCLADRLFGADPVRAEAGLVEAAATVGQLHAASLGRAEEYRDLRASFGAYDWDFPWNRRAELDRGIQEVKCLLQAACDSVGVSVPAGMDGEWSSVLTLLEPSSPFAFSADLGPDHYRYVDGRPRFIDFEASKYEPTFVEALIGRFVFPSSYLVNRLPPEMAPRMEAAYRAQLVTACPEAGDDRWFNTSLVNAGGLFILSRLSDRPLAEDLKEDREWGHASMRQRRLLHLEAFAAMTEEFHHLEVLGGLARALASRLRTLWEALPELPLYPAFRCGG